MFHLILRPSGGRYHNWYHLFSPTLSSRKNQTPIDSAHSGVSANVISTSILLGYLPEIRPKDGVVWNGFTQSYYFTFGRHLRFLRIFARASFTRYPPQSIFSYLRETHESIKSSGISGGCHISRVTHLPVFETR